MRALPSFMVATLLLLAGAAVAQQSGGVLRITHRDSPASLSIHEESTNSVVTPMMAVYNNLVIYDQHVKQNSLDAIRPDLAKSWSWSEDQTKLTFVLQEGVKWHDGMPFTARDVKCTIDLLLGRAPDKLRLNLRGGWYTNLTEVTISDDHEVTFHMKRPEPSILALLASGYTPIYPCHVSPATQRTNPVGTGPFKLTEFKRNETIRLTRNPDYWKKGLPYLDGIQYTIIPNRATALLSFVSGRFDMTFPYEMSIPLVRDIKQQMPQAICEVTTMNGTTNVLVNRDAEPFNNPDIRRALALTLDRKAFVNILSEGQNSIGGAMLPAPEGVWGMPKEIMETIPGYGPDVEKNRADARAIMAGLGYGPANRISIKVSTRNIPSYRDAAVILIDQLREIYIDAELDVVETAIWFTKLARKDYTLGMNVTGSGVDDPDQQFYENYACGSQRNYTNYCDAGLSSLLDAQSSELDLTRRKKMVWEIDRKLQEDLARPIIMHNRGGTCWTPKVRNLTIMVNSVFNGWRFEDVWMEK
jgi:peptide/nickel transport system substrate-binding protein